MYRIPYENEQITKTIAAPYAPVDFTEEEKEQFRENIGAGSDSASETELLDLKMLGWTVPKDFAVQNYEEDGEYHQRVGRVDLGTLNWITYTSDGKYIHYTDSITAKALGNLNILCNRYETVIGIEQGHIFGNITTVRVYVVDNNYTTSAAFKTAMNGVYLYYELATEITQPIDGNEITAGAKLLWENASPTSNFAAQDIMIPLSNYQKMEVFFYMNTANINIGSLVFPIVNGKDAMLAHVSTQIRYRGSTMRSDRLSLSDGKSVSTYSSGSTDNSVVIPFRIYGIK